MWTWIMFRQFISSHNERTSPTHQQTEWHWLYALKMFDLGSDVRLWICSACWFFLISSTTSTAPLDPYSRSQSAVFSRFKQLEPPFLSPQQRMTAAWRWPWVTLHTWSWWCPASSRSPYGIRLSTRAPAPPSRTPSPTGWRRRRESKWIESLKRIDQLNHQSARF